MKRIQALFSIVSYILVYSILVSILRIGCPIRWISGIPCAGCGMSRAYASLLHGDISSAFRYHPLFPIVPVAILMIVFKDRINTKLYHVAFSFITLIFIGVYFMRLCDPADTIIKIQFQNSIIYKLLGGLFTCIAKNVVPE